MKNKSLLPALAIILILSAFKAPAPGYEIGTTVKDFSLKSTAGEVVGLANLPDDTKGAIIVFTCNHCPFSQAYENRIIDLHNNFAGKGYPVVAINSNDPAVVPEDSYEEMIARANEHKYPFNYLFDETQEVATNFGAARTPHVFIVQKVKSNFVVKYIGAIDDNTDDEKAVAKRYVEDAVNALLEGKEVAVKSTKAIGCTIKWKK